MAGKKRQRYSRQESKIRKKSSYDNTPSTFIKGNIFKGPFHLPRMLMILFALERDGNFDEYLK